MIYFFSILLIFSSLKILFTRNTVYSILYLILCFFFSAILILIQGLDYIPLLFITIYVGALSILFIFVIMMLDIKIYGDLNYKMFYFIFFLLSFFFSFYFFYQESLNFNFLYEINFVIANVYCYANPIKVIGLIFFYKYYIYTILASFILFVSMIGSVCLVMEYKSNIKSQNITKQLKRMPKNSFFKVI